MARFSTKKYTRPVIARNIRKLSSDAFLNANTLADALSPRAGRRSAQFAALRNFVNLNKIFGSDTTTVAPTKTIKQNLLRALRS